MTTAERRDLIDDLGIAADEMGLLFEDFDKPWARPLPAALSDRLDRELPALLERLTALVADVEATCFPRASMRKHQLNLVESRKSRKSVSPCP